jgi:hypothetical protein
MEKNELVINGTSVAVIEAWMSSLKKFVETKMVYVLTDDRGYLCVDNDVDEENFSNSGKKFRFKFEVGVLIDSLRIVFPGLFQVRDLPRKQVFTVTKGVMDENTRLIEVDLDEIRYLISVF